MNVETLNRLYEQAFTQILPCDGQNSYLKICNHTLSQYCLSLNGLCDCPCHERRRKVEDAYNEFAITMLERETWPVIQQEISELREYIDLVSDAIASLIVLSNYPALESIFLDPAKQARVVELKAKLFPEVQA